MTRGPLASLAFGLAVGTAACGGADGGSEVVRRDSAGVEIVENPGTERALEWSFERVAILGGAMEGPESFTSVNPAGVAADSAGHLYVLDADAFRVVVFDSALEPVRTLGSEGEGPGTPVPILFLPDGRLVAEETDELDVDRLVVYWVDRSAHGEEG